MPREVEVKIILSRQDDVLIQKWLKKNARFVKQVHQLEYYLDHPGASAYFVHKLGFKDSAKYLRVRIEKEAASVCLKIFSINIETGASRNLDEIEFKVPNAKSALKFFKYLGFTDVTPIDKRRRIYTYTDFEIVLDTVKGLGRFAEFEYTGKQSSYRKELNAVYALLKEIGLKQIKMQNRGYVSMLWNPEVDFTKIKQL